VARARVARGSKSEHDAVVLDTGSQVLVLRRRGGHAYRDALLDELVGRTITAEGTVHGATFLVDEWELEPDEVG
jgi:hypothetical protein